MYKIKTYKKYTTASFVLLTIFLLIPFMASAAQEEKTMRIGDTWEKDGWHLSTGDVDVSAQARIILISLSYQGKNLGEARVENGKSYTYKGKNPDGSETSLFTIKIAAIFVGTETDLVKLSLNWSIPANDVQIIGVPVESDQKETETPVFTPAVQASPETPGFEMIFGIMGVLAVWWRLKK